jgi:hypothetical protein
LTGFSPETILRFYDRSSCGAFKIYIRPTLYTAQRHLINFKQVKYLILRINKKSFINGGILMGNRDFAKGEKKKPKKDVRKSSNITSNIEASRPEVEVIRKGKKTKDWEKNSTILMF